MKKRILALSLAAAMVVGALASCNGSETPVTSSQEAVEARDVSLVLWGSQEDQDYLKGVAADFCTKYSADHEDVKSVAIEVQVVGEDNSANEVMKDPSAAADVFGMPTDQIKRLADAKAIFAMARLTTMAPFMTARATAIPTQLTLHRLSITTPMSSPKRMLPA